MEMCCCGHGQYDHGHDPEYPGSTACQIDGCDCIAFEFDHYHDPRTHAKCEECEWFGLRSEVKSISDAPLTEFCPACGSLNVWWVGARGE